jgi:hypothetical protein
MTIKSKLLRLEWALNQPLLETTGLLSHMLRGQVRPWLVLMLPGLQPWSGPIFRIAAITKSVTFF